MDDPMRDRESCEPTTVLDHLRPTVVVRRRVVDVAALNRPKLESPEATESGPARSPGCFRSSNVRPEDDSAPPSSMAASEAHDSGEEEAEEQEQEEDEADETGHELSPARESLDRRHVNARQPREPLDGDDGEGRPLDVEGPLPVERAPVNDSPPVIPVGPTIAIGTMAKRLGVSSAQVAAELVTRGFFEVTPATVLSRDTARIVANAFGRVVEDVAAPEEPVRSRRKGTTRRAAPSKRTSKPSKTKKRTAPGRSGKRAA